MNMPEDFARLEQESLTNLEAWNRDTISAMQAFMSRMQYGPAPFWHIHMYYNWAVNRQQEIESFVRFLHDRQAKLLEFEPVARRLQTQGRLQLAARLQQILADMQNAIRIVVEANQGARQGVVQAGGIWSQQNDYMTTAILGATARMRAVFDEYLKRWSDVVFNKCPNCGNFLDSRFLYFCPYCRFPLRGTSPMT